MANITPVDAKFFQSSNGGLPPYCTFFAVAPAGSRIDHVFLPAFWGKVATTAACNGRLHIDDMVRVRAVDRTWDVMLVVSGFRADGTPTPIRWPCDPFTAVKSELPNFIPKTLVEACQVLGVELAADEDASSVWETHCGSPHPITRAMRPTDRCARPGQNKSTARRPAIEEASRRRRNGIAIRLCARQRRQAIPRPRA